MKTFSFQNNDFQSSERHNFTEIRDHSKDLKTVIELFQWNATHNNNSVVISLLKDITQIVGTSTLMHQRAGYEFLNKALEFFEKRRVEYEEELSFSYRLSRLFGIKNRELLADKANRMAWEQFTNFRLMIQECLNRIMKDDLLMANQLLGPIIKVGFQLSSNPNNGDVLKLLKKFGIAEQ